MTKVIRWGVLSTAKCAKERLVPAMLAAKNSDLLGIASRDEKKAKAFADNFNIPRTYESYDALLKDHDIDAVYIPLPNHMHLEWTIRAAEAGKHILCEKPAALNEQEVRQMIDACRKHGVLFMEAFAFRCHPKWHQLKDNLESNLIGEIQSIQAHYSILVENQDNIRLDPEKGGGALYDVGSYCVNSIRYIMDDEPISVYAKSRFADNGVDLSTAATLEFTEGRLAQFVCSIDSVHKQFIEITGNKGAIKINYPFRHPTITIQKNDKEETEVYDLQHEQYTEQVEHFCDCVLTGQSLWYDDDESIANMKVIDAIYQSAKQNK